MRNFVLVEYSAVNISAVNKERRMRCTDVWDAEACERIWKLCWERVKKYVD
jgi:hypothetical protein